jgi:iron(III) transport system ATP-binding protein
LARIDLEDLSLRYAGRDTAAVEGLTLSIEDGEFVTLIGPSGCGKTTSLRLLAGFLRPDRGRIVVDGTVLSSPTGVVAPEHRNMGMVFQSYAVWPHMTVFENVAFGLHVRRMGRAEVRKRVTDMLDMLGLAEFAERSPTQLSGGQQQRVALARALVVEPRTLLLDEPLSNLDAKLRERMRWELKSLQRRLGLTFVYVTHDQNEAMAVADRVAVLHDGRLQQCGPPREVYLHPANRFVADFMGSINLVSGRIEAADGADAVVRLLDRPEFHVKVSLSETRPNGSVTVAIRPEDVVLDSTGSGVPATVEQATFLGNLNDYVVAVPGEGPAAPLALRVQTDARASYHEGESVRLRIAGERCVVID